MPYKLLIISLSIVVIFFSCKKNKEEATPEDNSIAIQQELLKNIGEDLIVAQYKSFTLKSTSLKQACNTFINTPTLNNLVIAQNAWKAAKKTWMYCEVFNFGPASTLLINSSIDYADINITGIEANMSTTETIDNTYIGNKPSNTKGLTCLEYLLFDLIDDNNIINHYTTDTDFENRKLYLIALCENVETQASLIYNEWNPAGKNYLDTFKQKTGTQVGSGISMLINNMITSCDLIKTTKLGTPLGKTTGTITPSAVEAYYSRFSIACIKENISCFQYIMTGSGYGNMNGKGLNTLLQDDDFKENIYNNIIASIHKNTSNANNITTSLDLAAQNSDPNAFALYDSSNELLVLLKNDLSSVLNILVTFTDADGD